MGHKKYGLHTIMSALSFRDYTKWERELHPPKQFAFLDGVWLSEFADTAAFHVFVGIVDLQVMLQPYLNGREPRHDWRKKRSGLNL